MLGDGLPERGAFRGVARGVAEGGLGDANGLGGYPDPPRVQRAERDAETLPFLAQPVFLRDEHVVEEHVVGGRGDHTHLPRVRPEGDAFGIHGDDEGRNAFAGSALRAGEEDRGAGDTSVRDPLLVPGDAVAAFDPLCPRRNSRGIGARLRLGKAEAADPLPPRQRRDPASLLLLRSEHHDGQGACAGVYRERRAEARVGAAHLFE